MTIDISQFYQIFFEESLEGLDAMESSLMELNPDDIDSETINTIFRAAHSIKGGSATFGFDIVASFTHVLETLLDEIRNGTRGINTNEVDLFLQSVDCMRAMILSLQAEEEIDTAVPDELKQRFEAILAGNSEADSAGNSTENSTENTAAVNAEAGATLSTGASSGWNIYFKPELDVLRTGNEPLRMFRELSELGELSVQADIRAIPSFTSADPEQCFFAWNLILLGDIDRADIDEVFEWVVDDSEIIISEISSDDTVTSGTESGEAASNNVIGMEEFIGSAFNGNAEEVAVDGQVATKETLVQSAIATTPVSVSTVKNTDKNRETNKETGVTQTAKSDKSSLKSKTAPKAAVEASIRVGTDKIDHLINLVGELVITQSMLGQMGEGDSADFTNDKLLKIQEGLAQLEQNTRELQESVMRIRMLPISFTFSRFPRMVRDLSKRLDKKIDLILKGEQTELDKTVMEKIGDPMVHLVRNSVDHGIEIPAERLAAGKSETGTVTLNAFHEGGNVVIEITDDGAGLNRDRILAKAVENGVISEADTLTDDEICDLIFQPGFSTADEVSDVSGRGVGMDVVRRNIQELNGSVAVRTTPGKGSVFTIRLPLTLAILDGQLVRIGQQNYIFPLMSIVESIQIKKEQLNEVAGGCQVLRLRNEYIPIICLHEVFNVPADFNAIEDGLVVVIEYENHKYGIVVDDLLAQQQVVIKSLEVNYKKVEGISGGTILGDGTVALIMDVGGLVRMGGVIQTDAQSGLIESRNREKVA